MRIFTLNKVILFCVNLVNVFSQYYRHNEKWELPGPTPCGSENRR